jgi:hypothetical protein
MDQYLAEDPGLITDQFGHTQLGGVAGILANIVKTELRIIKITGQ